VLFRSPVKRLTIKQVLTHPWMVDAAEEGTLQTFNNEE
jgi:hypothetical protein